MRDAQNIWKIIRRNLFFSLKGCIFVSVRFKECFEEHIFLLTKLLLLHNLDQFLRQIFVLPIQLFQNLFSFRILLIQIICYRQTLPLLQKFLLRTA